MSGELPSPNGVRPATSSRLSLTEAIRRRRALAFGTPVAVLVLTVLFVLWVPPLFQANTDIRIDEEKSGVGVLQALQTLSSQGSEVFTEIAVLRSRTLAEEVTGELALQLALAVPGRTPRSRLLSGVQVDSVAPEATYTFDLDGPGRYRVSAVIVEPRDRSRPFTRSVKQERDMGEAVVGVPLALEGVTLTLAPGAQEHPRIVVSVSTFGDAVKRLQESLVVARPDREANVVRLTYRSGDPELVQAVLNALAENFIEGRRNVQSSEARSTVSFLAEQLDSLEGRLRASEEALLAFREANQIIAIEEEAAVQLQRLANVQVQRDIIEAERVALSRLASEVQESAAGEVPASYRSLLAFPPLLRNAATAELLAQLGVLETLVAETLIGRTESNPEVQLRRQRIVEIEAQLQGMAETYLTSLSSQVGEFDRALAGFEQELARIPAAEMSYLRLRRQAELDAELFTFLQTRRSEADLAAAIEDVSVRVVDPARYPNEPIRPKPWLSVFMAVVVGSIMGVGGAVAAEQTDRSVRDRRDVGRITGGAVLGLIPQMKRASVANGGSRLPVRWNADGRHRRPQLVDRTGAGDPAAEAYRSLRTNLLFSRLDAPPKVVVFTSPMPGDGKSTTAANLALVLAQQGQKVLLVDADMRRGLLHELFGGAREPGLSEVLFGRLPLASGVVPVEPREGVLLDFLPSGIWPPNPSELIASARMRNLVDEARGQYDMVILDAPPLNLVTDAAILGTHCDGVILVARSGVTEEAPLEYAVDQLRSVRAPLLGTVLNGVEETRQDYYGSRGKNAYAYLRKS